MSELPTPQPGQVSIFRDIYTPATFYNADLEMACNKGLRIVNALGVYPEPLTELPDELRPENLEDMGRYASVSYNDTALIQPYITFDSRTHLLSLQFSRLETGAVSLGATTLQSKTPGMLLTLEEVADAPLQAWPRNFTLSYTHPELTLQAAEVAGIANVPQRLAEQAQRATFQYLMDTISEYASRLKLGFGSLVGYLTDNAPGSETRIRELQAAAQRGDLTEGGLGQDLGDIGLAAFMRAPTDQRIPLMNAASDVVQELYERPEWEDNPPPYPYTVTFGAKRWDALMSTERLQARATWQGDLTDPRIKLDTKIEVDGTYDLREHVFTTAERARGDSSIEFKLERQTDSPDHTEAELGALLDEQIRRLGSVTLSGEHMASYLESWTNITPEPLPAQRHHPLPPQVKVTKQWRSYDRALLSYYILGD